MRLTDDELRRAMLRCPIFAGLDAQSLERLTRAAQQRTLEAGEPLWLQGEKPDAAALILSGRLDVCRHNEAGDRMLLRTLGPPECVGLSIVAGEAHSADLIAGEALHCAIVPGPLLRALVEARPELAFRALAHLGALLGQLTDELEDLRYQDIEERVIRCLRRHGRRRRELCFTHAELADQVGASRSNISRALKRLERRGAIRCGRGRITLLGL